MVPYVIEGFSVVIDGNKYPEKGETSQVVELSEADAARLEKAGKGKRYVQPVIVKNDPSVADEVTDIPKKTKEPAPKKTTAKKN